MQPFQPDPVQSALERARQLFERGDYPAAARIYQRLAAEAQFPQKDRYRLLAADALVQANDVPAAKNLLDSIHLNALDEQENAQLTLLKAQLALAAGKPEQALDYVETVDVEGLKPDLQLRYHKVRASAYALTGKLLESARERISAGRFLQEPVQIEENNRAILEALTLLSDETLKKLQQTAPASLAGWLALARLLKQYPVSAAELNQQIRQWRGQFPDHPADELFLQRYLTQRERQYRPPQAIAVLLPQSGPYLEAAQAIREGFIAAYYRNKNSEKPIIRFYDSQSANPVELYHQAVREGADFVVGPLSKENVRALLTLEELPIPVLALNQVTEERRANFYQFGLNPEEEAEQVANSAWFDGHRRALILAPASNFGGRIAGHFADYWQKLGGQVLEVQTYPLGENDFTYSIRDLLNLDEGEQPPVEGKAAQSSPHRRQDADFIFLVAQPREARLIRPQLQFYWASDLPIYATSLVFSGTQSISSDQDLGGIIFCDIPWLIEANDESPLSRKVLQNDWKPWFDAYLRLVALGIDAYNLLPQLHRLQNSPYGGVTGVLSMAPNNQIRRQLYCAQFTDGVPRERGLAPYLTPVQQQAPFTLSEHPYDVQP